MVLPLNARSREKGRGQRYAQLGEAGDALLGAGSLEEARSEGGACGRRRDDRVGAEAAALVGWRGRTGGASP
jgi:hypothetical protein